jgi:hypothetical protein
MIGDVMDFFLLESDAKGKRFFNFSMSFWASGTTTAYKHKKKQVQLLIL